MFALGVLAGAAGMVSLTSPPTGNGEAQLESTDESFRFIRASVESSNSGKKGTTRELKPFQYKVNALIENRIKSGDAVAVSFFFGI